MEGKPALLRAYCDIKTLKKLPECDRIGFNPPVGPITDLHRLHIGPHYIVSRSRIALPDDFVKQGSKICVS